MNELPKIDTKLYQIRPTIWVRDLLLDWATIVALFWLFHVLNSWYLLPVFALLIGSRQHALGLLGHDATHRLAFHNRVVNDWVGDFFVAWPLFVDIKEGYRPWHFAHHKYLGTSSDPELSYRKLSRYQSKPTWLRIVGYMFYDLAGLGIPELLLFMKAIFPYRRPQRFLGPVSLWSFAGLVTIYTNNGWILGLWAWSLLTGFWAVFRLRTWTEHVGVTYSGHENSHRFIAGKFARFLFCPHHTDHHYEHHRWAQIPYYNLPAARAAHLSVREVLPLNSLFEIGFYKKKTSPPEIGENLLCR